MIDSNGNHISDQSLILQEQENFYPKLYSPQNKCNSYQCFFDHNYKLTDEQKSICEGNLTFDEGSKALKMMSNGKSPGSDGFTVDFYKFFLKALGPFLCRSLHCGYEKEQL